MDWLRELARRLSMLMHRRQFDADLEEEVRLHLELRQEEQFESGMTANEARAAAQRRFGNATYLKEKVTWRGAGMVPENPQAGRAMACACCARIPASLCVFLTLASVSAPHPSSVWFTPRAILTFASSTGFLGY
jgi:hypothetical protein